MHPGPFRIVAWWCWYRGANFHGYQQQQSLRTVQKQLLKAFEAAGLERNPVVAGRTDKGVSARMQVLSGRVRRDRALDSLVPAVNAHLPDDVQLFVAREARAGFHAAFSSNSKEYRYLVPRDVAGDLAQLALAAERVPGTRDFRVFHFKSSDVRPRTVTRVDVWPGADGVTLRFEGDGFARYMVRMLVGALTAVARGEVSLQVLERALNEQQPFHCPTAPPEPLTLWRVGYAPEVDPFAVDDHARFEREIPHWPDGSPKSAE